MSSGGCPVCPGNSCDGEKSKTLSSLDLKTMPNGGSCGVSDGDDTEGQIVEIDSSKNIDVKVEVEISVNNSAVSLKGNSQKTVTVPRYSQDNQAHFELERNSNSSQREVGLDIELTLKETVNAPNPLDTLTVKRHTP
jgi:hypothetical protein